MHNGSATPYCCAWNPYAVGWVYTPTETFVLSSIETRFGLDFNDPDHGFAYTYLGRTVTASVWDHPNGNLLASTSFPSSPSETDWVGGSFAGISMTAGVSYFITWSNVGPLGGSLQNYLGVNAVGDLPSGEWSGLQLAYSDGFTPYDGVYDPIVRLNGITGTPGTVTPEPATLTLLATGLVGMASTTLRRKKQRA